MQLFVELDNVLADFDGHHETIFGNRVNYTSVNWTNVRQSKNFFAGLPMMEDASELWAYLSTLSPTILANIPSAVPTAAKNKREWVKKHIGTDVEVLTTLGRKRDLLCERQDVLIDASEEHKHQWLKAGGIFIKHVNAEQTIAEVSLLKF